MFELKTERRFIRAGGRSVRHVLATHVAREAESSRRRAPINIALVLDRSGSMGGEKMRLARTAVLDAVRLLKPADRFAVIAFDDEIDVVVETTLATEEAVRNAVRAVGRIDARGSTDLGGGWLRGCEQVARHLQGEDIGLALLVTDGQANRGIVDSAELCRHASELRQRNVKTSTFGIGSDFNEALLQAMATAGGGRSYFIETPVSIRDHLTSEVGEALEVTERDVEMVVHLPQDAQAEVVTGHVGTQSGERELTVRLADLVSRQEVAVVLALTFSDGEEGIISNASFELRQGREMFERAELSWTYRAHADNDEQPRDVIVDRAAATAHAARVRLQAATLNEHGRFEAARALLLRCAKKIHSYANGDRELLSIARSLEDDAEQHAAPMSVMELKLMRYASYQMSMSRQADGKARRR